VLVGGAWDFLFSRRRKKRVHTEDAELEHREHRENMSKSEEEEI
jgi:hypothetical protein